MNEEQKNSITITGKSKTKEKDVEQNYSIKIYFEGDIKQAHAVLQEHAKFIGGQHKQPTNEPTVPSTSAIGGHVI